MAGAAWTISPYACFMILVADPWLYYKLCIVTITALITNKNNCMMESVLELPAINTACEAEGKLARSYRSYLSFCCTSTLRLGAPML
jgi:hypothetical protein